jgi:hypothetical protein
MNQEQKLQAEIVMSFSQQCPEDRGLLWSVRNMTINIQDAMTQRAVGMVSGASDLMYFKDNCFIGIEVKTPGSRHDKDHVQRQLDWGMKIERQGGLYFIVKSVSGFWACLQHKYHNDVLTTAGITKLLQNSGKTIKF